MYVIRGYPQISQTYLKTELEALYEDYGITTVSRKPSDVPHKNHYFQQHLTEKDAIKEKEVIDIINKPVPEDIK